MIAPNSVVKLLENIKLTNDYKHTYSFANKTEQETFFLARAKYTLDEFTYIAKDRALRVNIPIDNLYNVSYLMYNNDGFSGKWFYGFILDLKYITDDVTEIIFELDVLQTWYFNPDGSPGYELLDCFVEREHVDDDTPGKHTVDEGLSPGEYVIKACYDLEELKKLAIVLAVTEYMDGDTWVSAKGTTYKGIFSGLKYLAEKDVGDGHHGELTQAWIDLYDIAGKKEAITNIFLIPQALVNIVNGEIQPDNTTVSYSFPLPTDSYSFGNYTPKNKKLYTYPYSFLEVTNNCGGKCTYKFENFIGDTCDFKITCDVSPSPTVLLLPENYNTENLLNQYNTFDMLPLTGYPTCSWVSDYFANWYANNQLSQILTTAGSALTIMTGAMMGNPVTTASGILGVANSFSSTFDAIRTPNTAQGSSTGSGNIAAGIQTFSFYYMTIKEERARQIDSFFTMYGYKVNELKRPNIRSRQYWNYIKTADCNIKANIPINDQRKIINIYNAGVTFWHDENIGDYSRTNSIRSN